ncbi:unannotated protein [freshwater metagenome]|uniref:Unannotated protein n=1 Tax=freshwater metagenome TaxID=449393 RepID=A0A6J7UCV5_9ZZZZ
MVDSLTDLTSNVRLILGNRTKLPQKSPRKFAAGPRDDEELRPAIAVSLAPATNLPYSLAGDPALGWDRCRFPADALVQDWPLPPGVVPLSTDA